MHISSFKGKHMKKLLVNPPSGDQKIIEVEEGGGYFDAARVLWDERIDGPLPSITLGGMVRSGSNLAYSQPRMDEHIAATKPSIPQSVTMRQARLALLGAGKLAGVTAAINALPSPQKEAAQIEWEYSQTVERQRGFVLLLGAALGLTDAQLDGLFVTAAGL